ncbi:MAG: SBBP repeat-containing protein [Candidatus Heimdallarchaeota archaeon]|nr:SBBP repeat-containing protein [Candidatus Heimdallarchaeota archaeon]
MYTNKLLKCYLIIAIILSATLQVHSLSEQILTQNHTCIVSETYPKLSFSTYIGGSIGDITGLDHGQDIAVSSEDYYYFTGQTGSNDFPTMNGFNDTFGGARDACISKFNGSSIIWSTYLGGNEYDSGFGIVIDGDGNCFVTGISRSNNFPTKNAHDSSFNGGDDVFLAKFSPNGSLLWSTYFGGNDWDYGYSIAVDNEGTCYITGQTASSNFPTMDAFDSTFNNGYFDAFVAKFAANGTPLWSTFLGGDGTDWGDSIIVTDDGSCYVTGLTSSTNFPTKNAYDSTPNGNLDVFVTKLNTNGSLVWSTYFGGVFWDEAHGVSVGSDDSCYITGYTESPNFPTLNANNDTIGDWGDAFLAKFATNGSLLWSTFLGGNGMDRGFDVSVTDDDNCFVTGETFSMNFPTRNAYNDSFTGVLDAFVSKFTFDGKLVWSTYLGGSRTDKGNAIIARNDGKCLIIGTTHSDDFPMKNAFDTTLGDTSDIFITIFVDTDLQPDLTNKVDGILVFIVVLPVFTFITVISLSTARKKKV